MNTSELVHLRHLNRRAAIYVRQSSPNQVITNKESQRMQYALRERATELGWHDHDVDTVDADLGRSGATTEGRDGYQNLVAQSRSAKWEFCWRSMQHAWPATVPIGISYWIYADITIV